MTQNLVVVWNRTMKYRWGVRWWCSEKGDNKGYSFVDWLIIELQLPGSRPVHLSVRESRCSLHPWISTEQEWNCNMQICHVKSYLFTLKAEEKIKGNSTVHIIFFLLLSLKARKYGINNDNRPWKFAFHDSSYYFFGQKLHLSV